MWFRRAESPSAPAATPAVAGAATGRADAVLRRLEWTVIRRLDGLLQGDYRTLMRGSGLDLADLREYQHHDDVRHIDWNVTARTGMPHVRVFTEDREMAAWFLMDLSASVDFGSNDRRKSDVAGEFMAVLARILTRHGNRVGALFYRTQVEAVLPARSGRRHVLAMMDAAQRPARASAGASGRSDPGGTTRLSDLLATAANVIKRRSTVFVVSDFISDPGWQRPLGLLAQRHDVVAVRVVDPLELDLPDLGLITLQDAESGEHLLVDTHDRGFRQRFARVAAQREAQLRASLARAGVDALELPTDGELLDTLVHFVGIRRRRTQLAGGGKLAMQLRGVDEPVPA